MTFLMLCRIRRVLTRLSRIPLGRLTRAMLLAIIIPSLMFTCARNTPTRLGAAPRVLLRTTKVLLSACLCTQVSGVILTIRPLNSPRNALVFSRLNSLLQSGCRHGLIPPRRLFGRKLSPLFVLMVGWARTTWSILPDPNVPIVTVIVRHAPLAFVGLMLNATVPPWTVVRHLPRFSAPGRTGWFPVAIVMKLLASLCRCPLLFLRVRST